MEKALNAWIEDQTRTKAAIITLICKVKAKRLYEYFGSFSEDLSDVKLFKPAKAGLKD
jgi:hypothetical protein